MLLYHGSERIIEKPLFGAGKPYNDYGLGFYCTEIPDMAREWACDRERDGYINKYEITVTDDMKILNLNGEGFTVMNWLAVLLENRTFDLSSPLAMEAKEYILENFSVDYKNADLIRGYRADDSYFSFAQDFLTGQISYQQLGKAMKLGNLGEQITIKSRKAFDALCFRGFEFVPSEIWFPKKNLRRNNARREYLNAERRRRVPGELFITTIIDEEMRNNDSRLR